MARRTQEAVELPSLTLPLPLTLPLTLTLTRWSYHLGAKLVLPLEYLRRCGATIPNSTLVLFTDHDVVFQGGAAQLRAAYKRAVAVGPASAGDAKLELVFSTEKESYPRELAALYPRPPAGAISSYLNSGMWMGPAGAAREMLAVMGGLRRGEQRATLQPHVPRLQPCASRLQPEDIIPAATLRVRAAAQGHPCCNPACPGCSPT